MKNANTRKSALISSVVALLICFAMLLGTTFAWFTDSVTSGSNVIKAGNLDIDVQYTLDGETWDDLEGKTLFQDGLWEPGHTELVALKITNTGTLALKYVANMNIINETPGTNNDGEEFMLSDILTVSTMAIGPFGDDLDWFTELIMSSTLSGAFEDGISDPDRIAAFKDTNILFEGKDEGEFLYSLKAGETAYIFVQIDMPETVGNEANYATEVVPTISFGINVLATQTPYEKDSFGNGYDKDAEYPGVAIPADAVRVKTYQEFSDALASGGNIALAADIEVTSSLDVTKDAKLYAFDGTKLSFASTAQMKVKDGATLDLMNVTVDNGDTFGFDDDGKFQIADVAGRNTAAIFDVSASSHLIIEKATTISNVVGKNQAVVMANGTTESRATVTVKGTIKNCAGTTGGVICANKCTDVYIEDGAVLKENVSYNSHNYGLIKIYDGSMLYMNGGEITNNLYAGNGLIGFQSANAVMNGGIIHNNNYYDGADSIIDSGNAINSRHGLIYAHSNSEFVINGGEIINNTVTWFGALDCMRKPTVTLVVNGGTVKNNLSREDFGEFVQGTDFFGTITSEEHITLSKNADVSGLIQDYSAGDDVYKDVTTLAK